MCSVKGLVVTCSGGKIAFAFIAVCSISNHECLSDPIAFVQGNASKNIHDIESMSFCRGLKDNLCWIQGHGKDTQGSPRSCCLYPDMLNRTLQPFLGTSVVLSLLFHVELQHSAASIMVSLAEPD